MPSLGFMHTLLDLDPPAAWPPPSSSHPACPSSRAPPSSAPSPAVLQAHSLPGLCQPLWTCRQPLPGCQSRSGSARTLPLRGR